MRLIKLEDLEKYRKYLVEMEKSQATIEKYLRDIRTFIGWLSKEQKNAGSGNSETSREDVKEKEKAGDGDFGKEATKEVTKECTIAYKSWLKEHYKTSSVSSMLVSLNRYLQYLGWNECCVKGIKSQRQMFSSKKELTEKEYRKLVETARKEDNEQLAVLIETIAGTGIRVSEVIYITVEAVQQGKAEVYCKGKCREIYLTKELRKRLLKYCRQKKITHGPVFVSKHGNPLDRSNIWSKMKKLSERAGVDPEKVFPHNLRHLFARTYYKKHKDIVYLADILGHTSINTTRIYTRTAFENHRRKLECLGLVC